MAAPLQRLGRLSYLKRAPWSILRGHSGAAFCSRSGDRKPGETQELARPAPDLTTVLHSRTRVSFPSSSDRRPGLDVARVFAEADPPYEAPVMAASNDGPGDSPSSSSSDSDSSDSDSDDEESSVGKQLEVKKEPVQQLPLDMKGATGRKPAPLSSSGSATAGSPDQLLDPGDQVCADPLHSFEAAEDTGENTPSPSQRSTQSLTVDSPAGAKFSGVPAKASGGPNSTAVPAVDCAVDRMDASTADVSAGGDLSDVSSTKKHAGALQSKTSLEAASPEARVDASSFEGLVEASNPEARVDASSFEGLVEASNPEARVDASSFEGLVEASNPEARVDASSFEGPVEASNPEAPVDASSFEGPVEAASPEARVDASSFEGPVEAASPEAPQATLKHTPSPQSFTVDGSSSEAPVKVSNAEAPGEGLAAEELLDAAPAVAAAEAEKVQESEGTAAPAEPEEPFDNSTYKNLQHHSYTPYTFADLDLEMAKYRLPQPSSGRPSPRH